MAKVNLKRPRDVETPIRQSKRIRRNARTPAARSPTKVTVTASVPSPSVAAPSDAHSVPGGQGGLNSRQHSWLESQITLGTTTELDLVLVMIGFRQMFGIPITYAGVCNKYYSMVLTKQVEETPRHQAPLARDHHLRLRSIQEFGDPIEARGDSELEEAYLREGFPAPGEACFNKPPTRRMHPLHPKYTYITATLMDNGYTWNHVMWLFGVSSPNVTIEVDERFWNINLPAFEARRLRIS